MNVLAILIAVLLVCAGLGALAGLVWGTVKFWRRVGPGFLKDAKREFHEAYDKGRGNRTKG